MSKSRPRKYPPAQPLTLKRRPVRKQDPCAAVKAAAKVELANYKKAAAIVGQVMAHFGAGVVAEREKTSPGSTAQIFAAPSDQAAFHDLLVVSVLKHLATLNWDTDQPGRDFVCTNAHKHGVLAWQTTPAPLTFVVILDTLREIQKFCPPGAGGGKVCDF
ncbi:MAG: hypothetical protein AB7U83_06225 [Vicinamibacterales bacterium]